MAYSVNTTQEGNAVQTRTYASFLTDLTPAELSALSVYKARYALESRGFTRDEARHIMFIKHLVITQPRAHA